LVCYITNHAHDDTGDLYIAPELCDDVQNVSCKFSVVNNYSCLVTKNAVLHRPHSKKIVEGISKPATNLFHDDMWRFGHKQ
jgi:hypothetical protein